MQTQGPWRRCAGGLALRFVAFFVPLRDGFAANSFKLAHFPILDADSTR